MQQLPTYGAVISTRERQTKSNQESSELALLMTGNISTLFNDFEDEENQAASTLKTELLNMMRRGKFKENPLTESMMIQMIIVASKQKSAAKSAAKARIARNRRGFDSEDDEDDDSDLM